MLHDFRPGDFLIFQLESGFALMRVLAIEPDEFDGVWHIAVYRDLFLETDSADAAVDDPAQLTVEIPHAAITNRAFESTQVAKMRSVPLTSGDLAGLKEWESSADRPVSDRSVRLLLGLR